MITRKTLQARIDDANARADEAQGEGNINRYWHNMGMAYGFSEVLGLLNSGLLTGRRVREARREANDGMTEGDEAHRADCQGMLWAYDTILGELGD